MNQKDSRVARTAKDLDIYRSAYELAMELFVISKSWPKDERYALTDQIRRSSRSVCANLREAWAKRRYPGHFVLKITDADAENSETDTWLDFARDTHCLSAEEHNKLTAKVAEVGRMLGGILKNYESFCQPQT
jgi:four helix bundle protein